ncbi:uncharacterized protein K460DRAFT_373451 [Cucurbitaria berberidis CBS 394.84]|uniref:Uncharacterized protein n=1 Tax=Cucurbitaria berberidis CBS 394.84 TaxID=1168544 RepID=A0A9P4GU86_9PLEO|nr:uncharacterized protein K460DRAFT_373451 [Cucurbitaria berberidis CBS 394.84]KAF1851440.1 hypothetical protein K460DRAFT_373451 [Cucurbitaria berberidis CBS 394.84]
MRADIGLFALVGLANASELISRQVGAPSDQNMADFRGGHSGGGAWRPKTNHPEFFSLQLDSVCTPVGGVTPTVPDCFPNFAIRLEKGVVLATPYNKWWDPKLPIFFVDDDTQLYTVSKKPLQLYIDSVTGALKYSPVGWLPPNAVSISFYHTGNNPLQRVGPSPAYLSWPTAQGLFAGGGTLPWIVCPLGLTGQYQVFIADTSFGTGTPAGVNKNPGDCKSISLAAINASPWRRTSSHRHN